MGINHTVLVDLNNYFFLAHSHIQDFTSEINQFVSREINLFQIARRTSFSLITVSLAKRGKPRQCIYLIIKTPLLFHVTLMRGITNKH